MDFKPGPATDDYPKNCVLEDNLIHHIGMYEKQVAGVELSMAMNINVSHNTIYHTPRAAVNISEGTWGGHVIAHNDLFDTVLETGDHGSINAWGRDRYWHPTRSTMDSIVSRYPKLVLADATHTIVIDHNRIRCDKGWDIDLDDGASNYRISNNLCLQGGVKLREGFHRTVENNILINNTFHPHVWFRNCEDVFRHNIVMRPYEPIGISQWGSKVDNNIFTDALSLKTSREKYGQDAHSCLIPLQFTAPQLGDYSISKPHPGFQEFSMTDFGVQSERLKAIAAQPSFSIPVAISASNDDPNSYMEWQGLRLQNIDNEGLLSATGMYAQTGVYVMAIVDQYAQLNGIIHTGDVILSVNGREIKDCKDLPAEGRIISLTVFRNQKKEDIKL